MTDETRDDEGLLSSLQEVFTDAFQRHRKAATDYRSEGPGEPSPRDLEPGLEPAAPPSGKDEGPPPEVVIPEAEPEAASAGETAPRATPGRAERSPLSSPLAEERRTALEEILERGLPEEEVAGVTRLVFDPERDIRVRALEAIAGLADLVDDGVVRQALGDPSDEVRAAAVRVLMARRAPNLSELAPVVSSRRYPQAQQTAFELVAERLAPGRVSDEAVRALLAAIGAMDSPPVGGERWGFAELGRILGVKRVARELADPGDDRLGAVRVLMEEGSPEALAAVSELSADPVDEIRGAAAAASDLLAAEEVPRAAAPRLEAPLPAQADWGGLEAEVLGGLAGALEDPDQGVRARARQALTLIDREQLAAWCSAALRGPDEEQASLVARVAEAASLTDLGPDLLARGASLDPEARGPFIAALQSLGADPGGLAASLDSVEAARRPDAVRLLWQALGRTALPHLRPLVADSAAGVRMAVLEVFAEAFDPAAAEVARGVLEEDSSPVVRSVAVQVLARGGPEERLRALETALADPDPDVRATAVEALAPGLGRTGAPVLARALADEDERVWQAAVGPLTSLPDADVEVLWTTLARSGADRREALFAALEDAGPERLARLALDNLGSEGDEERALAVSLAARAGTAECIDGVVGALRDPSPAVRRAAAASLTMLRTPRAIPALSDSLMDPDAEVREQAVRALSLIDDHAVLEPLVASLKDPEARVREIAGDALVGWRSPAVARRLVEGLTSPSLRRAAGELLARMGSAAIDPLLSLLSKDEPGLAGTVGRILEAVAGPQVFLDRLGSMDHAERLQAVEALGAMGGEQALEGLERALTDPAEGVRLRAVQLLGRLGDPRSVEAVKRTFLGDPVPEVTAAAEEILRTLRPDGDPIAES